MKTRLALFDQISRLVQDPPPSHIFEISEEGIAFAKGREAGFVPFPDGTIAVSPVGDNIRRPDAVARVLAGITPPGETRKDSAKKHRAVLILPDYAVRVSVLDFDSFPASHEEQLSLVRFRLKKTLPFDIDSAAVSYYAQPVLENGKHEVVATAVALEVVARYEALLRGANFHPGEVTTSSLAALNLYNSPFVTVIAKLAGRVLTVMVVMAEMLKLFRCVEMEEDTEEEVLLVLYPTLAYVEDELGVKADRLILCGFPDDSLLGLRQEYKTMSLESRFGRPDATNAGLLGYLEGAA